MAAPDFDGRASGSAPPAAFSEQQSDIAILLMDAPYMGSQVIVG